LAANDVSAMDLHYKQSVDYTYFCHSNKNYSWIDHIFCTNKGVENYISCKIIPEDVNNVSDHLPVQGKFFMSLNKCEKIKHAYGKEHFIPAKWSNVKQTNRYNELVCKAFEAIHCIDIHDVMKCDNDTRQNIVNSRFDMINDALQRAARDAGCIPNKILRPKTFWCPELSAIRDSKRFWWSIWIACGRPRDGVVFNVWKDLKKKFRKICRKNTNALMSRDISLINDAFKNRKMCVFWNKLKQLQRTRYESNINPNTFANFYHKIMTDEGVRTPSQQDIENFVSEKATALANTTFECEINSQNVEKTIRALKRGVAAGSDGVSVENLFYGLCPSLCSVLGNIYSIILSTATVPDAFKVGILVPILKKPTLDTNLPENYRPVSLSSVHSKIIEYLMKPDNIISDSQFGFQSGRGTSFVTCLLNDTILYFNENQSCVYVAALDAEKCFDSIWHSGLFYKLWGRIPNPHWLFLLHWYQSSFLKVKWNNEYSSKFLISKGMRQGSIMSPYLFNIFIDDLLCSLKNVPSGIRIDEFHTNHAAYADDINLISSTPKGLQSLIDVCSTYAKEWKFKFGLKKSKCICFGKNIMKKQPTWHLDGGTICLSEDIDVLGVSFDNKMKFQKHVSNRNQSCRKSIYRLTSLGMSYPGLNSKVKSYLWKAVGSPTLLYGMESVFISKSNIKDIMTCEGNTIKRVMGLGKRSHHSKLCAALSIKQANQVIAEQTANFFYRIFQVDTPLMSLQSVLLSKYLKSRTVVKGTILDRLIKTGYKPLKLAFEKQEMVIKPMENGLIDSLKYLLFHENYSKPWSSEHMLVTLLTKAF
jgi:hypothetical protein